MENCKFLETDGSCNCYDPRVQQLKEVHYCKDNSHCYYKQLQAEKEKAIKYLQMYYKAKAGLL